MACLTEAPLKFTVHRKPAVLVAPAAATPRELKRLSDTDDQDGLRFQVPTIYFYRRHVCRDEGAYDPARIIRDAVARALVHYYPLAGRLRELKGHKLAVDCTSEGVLFIEADADISLEHFGEAVHPPLLGIEELLFDVPGSSATVNCPLLLFQVTRLACGGFILAMRIHHAMADSQGMVQFLGAIVELVRGARLPTVQPIWGRELLDARNPPRATFAHHEYDEVPAGTTPVDSGDVVRRHCFFLGPGEVAAIRALLPLHLRSGSTTFEMLAGFLWKCRTMALAPNADEEMRLLCTVSARGRMRIPRGYYGNSFATPAAVSAAGKLCSSPVGYAVELVKKAKDQVDMEYIRSAADLLVLRGRPHITVARSLLLSGLTKKGFGDIDFGWGRPVYGGPAKLDLGVTPGVISFLVPCTNAKGEDGIIVPMCLPATTMDRFMEEMDRLLSHQTPHVAKL